MTISLMLPLVGKTQTDLKRVDKGTGPLSFTRATTATRTNPDTNLIESVASGDLREDGRSYYNRLLYSEDFSQAAWVKTSVAVSNDNVLGPDGKTGMAQTLTASATNGTCLQALVDTSRARYGSLYLKRKTGAGNIQVTLDGGSTWTTVSVTADWTRLGAGQTLTNPSFGVRLVTSGDAVYVLGAQVADVSAATRYVKSAANPAYAPLGVLTEGQRTNLFTYSEQFDNEAWLPQTITVTANQTTSPDGAVTADKIEEDSTNNGHHILRIPALAPDAFYTFSVFSKKGAGRDYCRLLAFNKAGMATHAWFNLATGVKGTVSGAGATSGIESCGNGWYRVWITYNTETGAEICYHAIGIASADEAYVYIGGGASCYIYAWGAQLEKSFFPSSYIPTTSAAVTRNADALTFPSSGNISPLVGSVRAEFSVPLSASSLSLYNQAIIGGSNMPIYMDGEGPLKIFDGIGWVGAPASPGLALSGNKGATRWSGSEMAVCLNGGVVGSGSFDGDLNIDANVVIGGGYAYFGPEKLHLKYLFVSSRAPSDAEMIAITS